MDYSKFFTFQRCYVDFGSNRSDKVGTVTLVATKKNIFYKEGERVNIGLYNNCRHGRMSDYEPVRDFMDYFGAGNDFLEFLFDLWEKNKPTVMRYGYTYIKEV
jgi:hypothetical protein